MSLLKTISIFIITTALVFTASCNPQEREKSLRDAGETKNLPLPRNAIPVIYEDYIHIKGSVNGNEGIFLIDTGADNLYLDTLFYAAGGYSFKNLLNYRIEGVWTGYQNIIIIQDTVDFSFGNYRYKTSFVPVMKLKPIGGDFIDGLLGTAYFLNSVLEINYSREYIQIYKSIDQVDVKGYDMVPLKKIDHSYTVPVKITIDDLTLSGNFLIDLANPSSSLTTLAAYENNLQDKIELKAKFYDAYGGVGGESAGYEFIAQSVAISNFSLPNAILGYSIDTAGMLKEGDYIGMLGNNILDRFSLIFDFPNNNLYIRPGENFEEPFVFNKLGFKYVDRCETLGGWIVTGMYDGSMAEQLGLRVDDKIISINDTPAGEIRYEEQGNYFKNIDRVKINFIRSNISKTIEFDLIPLISNSLKF